MAKVLGIGGIFFKAEDPAKLAEWYGRWLGIPVEPEWNGASLKAGDMPASGYTVWSPFAKDTTYFAPSEQVYMINLVVDDVDGALAQVAEGGASLVGEPESNDYGRFGWFIDPEGNKVELWKPE
jgi:predicted enzyme related to lactoylglutathione lyase